MVDASASVRGQESGEDMESRSKRRMVNGVSCALSSFTGLCLIASLFSFYDGGAFVPPPLLILNPVITGAVLLLGAGAGALLTTQRIAWSLVLGFVWGVIGGGIGIYWLVWVVSGMVAVL